MMILGGDPGLTGAFALYDGTKAACIPVPNVKAKGRGRTILINELVDRFGEGMFGIATHAFMEKVGVKPGEGVSSAFKFGRTVGVMEAIIACNRIPVTHVTPQKWKRAVGLIGAPKKASLLRASELMPNSIDGWTPKRLVITQEQCIGTAEAALIAWYGFQQMKHGDGK